MCSSSFNNLRITSFNCRGLKSSVAEIRELCSDNDIILLQETWLYGFDAPLLGQISSEFVGRGVYFTKSDECILRGRPSGGLAVLWRKAIGTSCKIHIYEEESRMMGLSVNINNYTCMIVNVYLPYCSPENHDEFLVYLSKIDDLITASRTPNVFVVGDFNADVANSANHAFGKDMLDFCSYENLIISDIAELSLDSFSCFSEAHSTTSWLDHIVSTKSAHSSICNINIKYDFISSDHFPITFNVDCNIVASDPISNTNNANGISSSRVFWDKLSSQDIKVYTDRTKHYLSNVPFPHDLAMCEDSNCSNPSHKALLQKTYTLICDALKTASEKFQIVSEQKDVQIPGWTDCCKEAHSVAREAFLLWRSNNSPKHGIIFDNMKITRAHFKLLLRQCKQAKDSKVADSLASKFLHKNKKSFWSEVKKITYKANDIIATDINGVSGENEICDMWKNHFRSLLNSSRDNSNKPVVEDYVNNNCNTYDPFVMDDVLSAIQGLKKGKTPGSDGLSGEHFIYAHDSLYVHILILINAMLVHGFLPDDLMTTIIIPLLKDKKGNISSLDNYRPIAITTVFSKILELLILYKYRDYLSTTDHQFGFKEKHSTEMCCFLLKEVINFYISSSTPMYLCFMDASKAFDKVNHFRLFSKLKDRGLPATVIRILVYWYRSQLFSVKWCNVISGSFKVTNGVRQGGILSPYFYNVFVDELSLLLSTSNAGCYMEKQSFNHLFYADDSVLMAPSPAALQTLINICVSYAHDNEITYNCTKTRCMCILPSNLKDVYIPLMHINGVSLEQVCVQKYLGVYFTNNLSDITDMKRELRQIYGRANLLIRKFSKCDFGVKLQLFKSYCTNLYCDALWVNFNKDSFNKVKVAYNNGFRSLFNLTGIFSITSTFVNFGMDSFTVLLRKSIVNLYTRIINSHNVLLRCVTSSDFFLAESKLFKRWKCDIYC